MKISIFLALAFIAFGATAQQPMAGSAAPAATTTGTLTTPTTTTSIPQAGTSAGSPQNAGPLNAAPNGAGGTYGYPNAAIDPNTTNPGLPQQPYYSSPYTYYGNRTGTVSGTTTSVNPAGAPFVTPPAIAPVPTRNP